jgi:class 3 adenylate cyclase
MSILKPGWLSLKLLLFFLVPAAAYVWFGQTILSQHLKNSVTNNPEQNLARSLSTVQLALEEQSQQWAFKAARIAEKDNLKKDLTPPLSKLSRLKKLGANLYDPAQTPLLVLVNAKGNAFYDTLDLAAAPPVPAPSSKKKSSTPSLPSVKDWPGISGALKGASSSGLFTYQNSLYLAAIAPVFSQPNVVGAVLVGAPFDLDLVQNLKSSSQADMAFYAQHKIQFSTLPKSFNPDLEKTLSASAFASNGPSHRKPIHLGQQDYAWDEVPVLDFDQNPYGYLVVFQPAKQTLIVNGDPKGILLKFGFYLIGLMLLLLIWTATDILIPLVRFRRSIEQIKDGDLNLAPPSRRTDELGSLDRSFSEMASALKERERISLVLGKVLAPQVAKRLLADRDHFALKGERRECVLLYAELKGFNPLSENLEPDQLVEALNQYYSLIHGAVFKEEGMLDKFMGESLLAVWGAPFTHEDKEFRALKAAFEIQKAVKSLNLARMKKGQPTFSLGIALHRGLVISGNLGSDRRNDYTVIGPAVEIVRKLCVKAAQGQILISGETYEKIEDRVKVKMLDPLPLSNRPEPLKIYEAVELT